MFCGSLPEMSDVVISDVESSVIKTFIRFLYTDECDINPNNVMGLLYTAKKYDILALFNKCKTFLKKNLTAENVFTILEQVQHFAEEVIEKWSLQYISMNTFEALKSESAVKVSRNTVKTILELMVVNCDESVMYNYCKAWAVAQCLKQDKESSDENMRGVLGELLHGLKFSSLSLESFIKLIDCDNILTAEEKFEITKTIVLKQTDAKFGGEPRKRLKSETAVARFRKISAGSWNYRSELGFQHSIAFCTLKPGRLSAIGLFTPVDDGETSADIKVYEGNNIVSEMSVKLHKSTEQYCYKKLTTAVVLKPSIVYTIVQTCKGSLTFYGLDGIEFNMVGNVTVQFFEASHSHTKSSNGTSIERGQIYGLSIVQ